MSGGRKRRSPGARRKNVARRKPAAPFPASPSRWIVAALLMLHLPPLFMVLSNAPYIPWRALLPLAVLVGTVPGIDFYLRRIRFRGDPAIVYAMILLMGLGLALQFRFRSFSGGGVLDAWALPLLAVGLMLGALRIASRGGNLLRKTWGGAYLAALGLMVAVLVLGRRFRGAVFLPGGVNPVEIVKPLLCVAMAGFLAGHAEAPSRERASRGHFLLTLGCLWAPVCGLLLVQRDLGMLLLLNLMLLAMLGGIFGRWGWIGATAIAALGLGVLATPAIPHVAARVEAWLHPFADPTGKGWQALQALSAMYAGGVWGRGLGAGSPQSVPIFSSDFIYAAVAEEMGFAGCVLLVALYALLIGRTWEVSRQGRDAFDRGLAYGGSMILGAQVLLNLGGVVKALPMTGVPLPFVSQGGSSLLSLAVLAGLLAGVSDPGRPGRKRRKKRGSRGKARS